MAAVVVSPPPDARAVLREIKDKLIVAPISVCPRANLLPGRENEMMCVACVCMCVCARAVVTLCL